jgi:hypothetical protein
MLDLHARLLKATDKRLICQVRLLKVRFLKVSNVRSHKACALRSIKEPQS